MTSTRTTKKPNIVVLVSDDQGYADLNAYDHAAPDISTPNLDRIAASGLLFTQAYVTAPVCSPSRAGWNTGCYQQRFGGWDWEAPLPKNRNTLAEMLKAQGYVTGKFGKNDYGVNYHSMAPREYPLNHGYDEFTGFSSHAHDYFCLSEDIEKSTPDPYGESAALGRLFHNRSRESYEDAYTTEVFTDAAISFLDRHREEPLFLNVSYNAVHHLIHEVPDRYLAKHGVRPLPKYDPSMGLYRDYYSRHGRPGIIREEEFRRYYLANIECLDDNVGRLLDALDRLGLTQDTLLFYFSDNGGCPHTGSCNLPLSGSKYSLSEGGIRIPFMMRWPGRLPEGRTNASVVSSLDIAPTCLAAAGGDCESADLDGIDLLSPDSGLSKKTSTRPTPLHWEWGDQFAVRDGKWKLVNARRIDMETRTLEPPGRRATALFNLEDDPAETNDLIDACPQVAKHLQDVHAEWKRQVAQRPAPLARGTTSRLNGSPKARSSLSGSLWQ